MRLVYLIRQRRTWNQHLTFMVLWYLGLVWLENWAWSEIRRLYCNMWEAKPKTLWQKFTVLYCIVLYLHNGPLQGWVLLAEDVNDSLHNSSSGLRGCWTEDLDNGAKHLGRRKTVQDKFSLSQPVICLWRGIRQEFEVPNRSDKKMGILIILLLSLWYSIGIPHIFFFSFKGKVFFFRIKKECSGSKLFAILFHFTVSTTIIFIINFSSLYLFTISTLDSWEHLCFYLIVRENTFSLSLFFQWKHFSKFLIWIASDFSIGCQFMLLVNSMALLYHTRSGTWLWNLKDLPF